MTRIARLCLSFSVIPIAVSSALAAPHDIRIPDDFASTYIPYTTVDKRDREPNVVRFMYISPDAATADENRTLPEGTRIVMIERVAETDAQGETIFTDKGRMVPTDEVYRIIVSEKRPGTAGEYTEEMRIGDWEFGVFQPDGSPWPDVDFDECRSCHKKAEQSDFTFSVYRNLGNIAELGR